ncbi:hypothetical protein VQ042_16740 [Aurantimonas sp. A2-1-M11]|uniref:hypothetical protein n=1 Tax=Aurantimonas sp. A2-1-M11 TaxID=3113712 RepID=UPI002F933FFF
MFDRLPTRLDDAAIVSAAIRALAREGYDRHRIEDALIRQAPVDLDLLAECYERMFGHSGGPVLTDRAA